MRVDSHWEDGSARMEELRGLAKAAGYDVLAEISQRRGRDSRYQIGKGKIAEAVAFRPDRLIFYNPLSPGQLFHISSEFDVPPMDRFNLILEIFASRAQTREAKLQVELARLTYEAPFARTMASLRKLSERPGFRGSGAYDESAYQDIRGRMAKIRSALKDVEQTGEDRRERRRELGFDLVALAGYTNAGKSSLLNALTGSAVAAEDELFTTLSPTTRSMKLGGRGLVLTDTVGFIDDLPHFMIKAFRSTLSEITYGDLILLVADLSDPPETLRKKLVASHAALWECKTKAPMITVLNKADLLSLDEIASAIDLIWDLAPHPVVVSVKTGDGFSDLLSKIEENLPPWREQEAHLPYTEEGLDRLYHLYGSAEMLDVRYGDEINVRFRSRNKQGDPGVGG